MCIFENRKSRENCENPSWIPKLVYSLLRDQNRKILSAQSEMHCMLDS